MGIAAFDLDGTLIKKNSSFAFCRYLCEEGVIAKRDFLFCIYSYYRYRFFSTSLHELHTKVFNRLFRGKSFPLLSEYARAFVKEKQEWYAPACERLHQLQTQGVRIIVCSSSPQFLVELLVQSLQVTEIYATQYCIDKAGFLQNIQYIVDGSEKKRFLEKLPRMEPLLAFSDHHDDLPFLESATQAITVNPNRLLKKIARARKWEIL